MFDYAGMLMGGGQGFGGGTNAMTMDPRAGGQQMPWWMQRMGGQQMPFRGMGGMGGMGGFPGMGGQAFRPDIMRGNFGQMPFGGMPGRGMAGGAVPGMGGVAQPSGMPQQPMIGPGGPVGPVRPMY